MDNNNKPNIRRDLLFSFAVIIAFFVGFGLWAALAPLESAAIAPGQVMVSGYRKTIQHLEGGIVEKINVRNGSKVKKDQVLVKLHDIKSKATFDITANQLDERLITRARIQAELDNAPLKQMLPKDLPNTLAIDHIVSLQGSIYMQNKNVLDNAIKIHQQQLKQLEEQINGTRSQVQSSHKQYEFIQHELVDVRALAKKRLVKQSRLLALEREAARIAGDKGRSSARIAELEQQVGEVQIEINKQINQHRQELLTELKDTQQAIADLKSKEIAEGDILSRTTIRSPIDGVVTGLKVHTIGGVIKPGEVLMDIVPQDEELRVEARISPLDIDVVRPGLVAKVTLTAFKQRTTPMLKGKVLNVSADAFIDEQTGQPY